MKQAILSSVTVLCLAVVVPAFAGPPFGGDDTGCVPDDKASLLCGMKLAKALAKLTTSVVNCHLVQAEHAFQTGHSAPGFDNAEENCESGPSNTSAKAQFDNFLTDNAALTCDPAVVASAQSLGDALLSGASSLDVLNGSFFCDDSSGSTIAEPGGDDAGFIPSTPEHFFCTVRLARLYAKLVASVHKCHSKAASYAFASKPFDEEACEDAPLPAKSAFAVYAARIGRYLDAGICPPCVADSMSPSYPLTLASDAIASLDAANGDLFPCPSP